MGCCAQGLAEGLTFTRQLDPRTGYNELYLVEDGPVSAVQPATAEPKPSDVRSTEGPRSISNISLWSFIIGDDVVGLPVSTPAFSLWAYIAGADRVPGCRPAARSVGVLGYIIGEDRLLDT